jgi:hypothetical protein
MLTKRANKRCGSDARRRRYYDGPRRILGKNSTFAPHFSSTFPSPCSSEGVFRRRLARRSRVRRPRAGLVTPRSGGPGQPSAGTKTGCLEWLDVAGTKGGGSRPDQEGEEPSVPRREARRQGQKPPRRSATGRARLQRKTRPRRKARTLRAPRGAPSPRASRPEGKRTARLVAASRGDKPGKDDGAPAPQTTGAMARAFTSCRTRRRLFDNRTETATKRAP